MRCLLVGNYGAGNVGDELLRSYFVERFPEVAWTVVSASPIGPMEVPRLPLGIRSFFRPWWTTLRAFWSADAVVFGGGTLFTDTESLLACRLWGMHALMARVFRKPIILAFQGIGPFHTAAGKRWARRTIARAAFVSVRDRESLERVRALCPHARPSLTFDPVILLLAPVHAPPLSLLTVIPRGNTSTAFVRAVRQEWGSRRYADARIVSLQPDDPAERRICEEIAASMPTAEFHPVRTADEFVIALRGSRFVLAQRYHGAIGALALQIPFRAVAMAKDDKLAALAGVAREGCLRSALSGEEALRSYLASLRRLRPETPRNI